MADPRVEQQNTIPLDTLYNLNKNQMFMKSSSVALDPKDTPGPEYFNDEGLATAEFEARKTVLESTGLYSAIERVKELDPLTGEPTGISGIVVTKKEVVSTS